MEKVKKLEIEHDETEYSVEIKIEKVCPDCGGTGIIVTDYHDPSDPYGHGQTEQKCLCQIKEPDDTDDDS